MNNLLYLGIDVSLAFLDCHLRDGRKKSEFRVCNDREGILKIIEILGDRAGNTQVAVEATSTYHRLTERTLKEAGAKVLVLNPARSRALALGLGVIDKDDKVDAKVLAEAARLLQGRETRTLSKLHEQLRDLSRAITSQVEANAANKKRLASLEKGSPAYEFHKSGIKAAAKQIADGKRQWRALVKDEPEIYRRYQQALSVPDVGMDTARVVACEISADLEQYTVAQICAYAGVVPRRNESGARKGAERIGKTGNAHLRTGVFMASTHSVFRSKRNADLYKRLMGKGHTHVQAMIAVVHRLLREVVSVMKRDSVWEQYPPTRRNAPVLAGATT